MDHRPGGKDDLVNAASGALVQPLQNVTDTVDATAFGAINAELRGRSAFTGYSPDQPRGGTAREKQSVFSDLGGGMFGGSVHKPDITR